MKLKFRKTTIILSVLVFIFVCISIGFLVAFLTKKCDDKQGKIILKLLYYIEKLYQIDR